MPSVILATAGYDHVVRFWDSISGSCFRTLAYPDKQVNRLAISPDKRSVAVAGNPNVKVFDIPSQKPEPVRTAVCPCHSVFVPTPFSVFWHCVYAL